METDHSVVLLLTGLIVGFIGTIIGAGGGFILVPVLLLAFPDAAPETIVSISLAITFLNALSGTLAYARMKRIDYRSAIDFSLATIPGAIIGALVVGYVPAKVFEKAIGIVLIGVAVFLMVRGNLRKKGTTEVEGHTRRDFTDKSGEHYVYSFRNGTGLVSSFFVGLASSLLGIGGGIIHVPVMTTVLNFPVHVATATSHFILSVMALASTIVHIFQGTLNGHWITVCYLGAGVVAGAQAGAKLSHYAKPHWILYGLAAALIIVGLRILLA